MVKSICIVGDISLDIVTNLDNFEKFDLQNIGKFKHISNSIFMLPGGTGSILALAAIDEGFENVWLIGKLGADPSHPELPDIAGQFVSRSLQKARVKTTTELDPSSHTGVVMITYLPNDHRIMVVDKGANANFTRQDISQKIECIVAESNILFVSGYALLKSERAQAVHCLMQIARQNNRLVVLDVVPHELHTLIDTTTFCNLTEHVNVIVSEVNTIKRIFFSGNENKPESDLSTELVAKRLLQRYNAVILRPDNNYQYLIDRDGIIEKGNTGYISIDSSLRRGYSERLAVRLLRRHCGRLTSQLC